MNCVLVALQVLLLVHTPTPQSDRNKSHIARASHWLPEQVYAVQVRHRLKGVQAEVLDYADLIVSSSVESAVLKPVILAGEPHSSAALPSASAAHSNLYAASNLWRLLKECATVLH